MILIAPNSSPKHKKNSQWFPQRRSEIKVRVAQRNIACLGLADLDLIRKTRMLCLISQTESHM